MSREEQVKTKGVFKLRKRSQEVYDSYFFLIDKAALYKKDDILSGYRI